MHHVFTLCHNSVALLETGLTKITRLRDEHIAYTHIAWNVLKHIFLLKKFILDKGNEELENHIDKQHHHQANHNTL